MSANQSNGYNVTAGKSASPLDSNLLEALESSRDRISVLRLEQEIILFLTDDSREALEIPSLNSYQRLLAHKTGDYYHLTHVSDPARQTLLFHKHPWSRIPALKLCEVQLQSHAKPGTPATSASQAPQVRIMKRDPTKSPAPTPERVATPATSEPSDEKGKNKLGKEERYRAARARIFQGVEEMPVEKSSPSDSKDRSASRSNSRDARQRSARRRDAETPSGFRSFSSGQDFPLGSSGHLDSSQMTFATTETVHQRHQQYFQPALGFSSPASDNRDHPGLWSTGTGTGTSASPTPLSIANLATLEAQTSRSPNAMPLFSGTSNIQAQANRPLSSRVLVPPATSGGNLWGPPLAKSPLIVRNASALGLNLGASPWTPKSTSVTLPQPGKLSVISPAEDDVGDPTNVLRGLALDEKK